MCAECKYNRLNDSQKYQIDEQQFATEDLFAALDRLDINKNLEWCSMDLMEMCVRYTCGVF